MATNMVIQGSTKTILQIQVCIKPCHLSMKTGNMSINLLGFVGKASCPELQIKYAALFYLT